MKHELIVALDVPSAREAAAAVARIGDAVSFYKVGLELFLADGPETLRMLRGEGRRVFLDLKLHDIPRTVERAVGSCLRWAPERWPSPSSRVTSSARPWGTSPPATS